MDHRYEKLRTALRELGEIPLHEPPGGWEEYALHQRAACVATHAARLEAVAELQALLEKQSPAPAASPDARREILTEAAGYYAKPELDNTSVQCRHVAAFLLRLAAGEKMTVSPADSAASLEVEALDALEVAQRWFLTLVSDKNAKRLNELLGLPHKHEVSYLTYQTAVTAKIAAVLGKAGRHD